MAGPGDGDAELLLSHTVIHYSTPHRKKKAPRHIKAAKMLDAPRRRYYNKRAGFVPAYTPRCCAVGSARGLGPRGRRFESCHLDQNHPETFVSGWSFCIIPHFLPRCIQIRAFAVQLFKYMFFYAAAMLPRCKACAPVYVVLHNLIMEAIPCRVAPGRVFFCCLFPAKTL